MTAASVSGITILEEADQSTDGTLISGGTSPTSPSNYSVQGIRTTASAGWSVPLRHNITPGSSRYVGKRFTFSSTNLTGKVIIFGATCGGPSRDYLSVFAANQTPPVFTASADSNIHMALGFTLAQNGSIVGGRFFKLPNNTGVHTLSLYTNAGAQQKTATYSDESDFGWQDLLFSSPFSATAATAYRIAYKAPDGNYAATGSFFASSFVTSRGTGTQGYYAYDNASTFFPNSTFNNTNYWVDVLFVPTGATPPFYPSLDLLDTKANRGLVVRLYSGGSTTTNYIEAVIAGESATNAATFDSPNELNTAIRDWTVFVLDPATAGLTTAGTFDITAVTSIEFRSTFSGQAPSFVSINKICSLAAISITGGTSPNAAGTFSDFISYQSSSSIKTWFGASTGTQYFFVVPLQIGNGSTATRFAVTGGSVVWHAKDASTANPWRYIFGDSILGLTINSSASDSVALTRVQFSSASKVKFQVLGTGSITLTDCIMPLIGSNAFNVGTLSGCIFDASDRLVLNGATFTGCAIQNSTDATGALYWQSTSSTISGCVLSGNTAAIAVVLSGDRTINLSALTFSGNTNDWIVTGSGTLTIVVDAATTTDKTWANTSGGTTANGVNASGLTGNVVFQMPAPTIQVEVRDSAGGALSGINCAVYKASDNTELLKSLTNGSGIASTTYNGSGLPFSVIVRARKQGYKPAQLTTTLTSSGLTVPISLEVDGNV